MKKIVINNYITKQEYACRQGGLRNGVCQTGAVRHCTALSVNNVS